MLQLIPLALAALTLAPNATLPLPQPTLQPALQEGLADAEAAFHRIAVTGTLAERVRALEAVTALGDPAAVGALQAEFARVSTRLRKARDDAFRTRYVLERQESLYEQMKLRAERDDSLAAAVKRQEERIQELHKELAKSERDVAELGPWYEALGAGTGEFFAALPAAKRKKAEKAIWGEIDGETELPLKLAAIELLGYCGGEGTAVSLQKVLAELCKEQGKLKRQLPKEMVELRKLEERWQKEQDQMGGRHTLAMQQQYERAKKAASELQRAITLLGYLADACAEAGARALDREEGKLLEKSLQKLLRVQGKGKDGARQRTLRMLGTTDSGEVRAALRALLATEKEVSARATVIDALAESGDLELESFLLQTAIGDPEWLVRSRAAAALARLRSKEAIPVLIGRLEAEDGRLRTDLRNALVSLTGQDFRTNAELWRRWWRENGEDFEVPAVAELEEQASEDAKESLGVTFFGIETESRRVLFVLDLSRSMTFSMVPRNNPNDEDAGNPDMPREGELSRLQEAKRALTRALGGIEDESIFNIVFYATDVWAWQDRPVEMDDDNRSEALRFVEALEANGGTNIYGALELALGMAGADGGDEWSNPEIDTIYFLSDGRASIGVTTEPDEILAFVRERNATAGITIHAIGLSGAQDAYLLRSLAEQNGGTYAAR